MIPFAKWAPDQYDLNANVAGEASGVLPGGLSKRPWPGLAAVSAPLRVTRDISDITQANPAVVTYSGSDEFSNGDVVRIADVVGMTEVNGRDFTVANLDTGANTFELSGEDSTGHTAYSSGGTVAAPAVVCRGAIRAQTSSGVATIFAGSTGKLFKYAQAAHPSWTDVTRTSGGDYSLGSTDFWSFTQFGKYLIAVNGADAPQVIDIDSGTAFAALSGSPPTAKYCQTVGDVVLLMNLSSALGPIADSGRVQVAWSGFRSHDYWTYGKDSSSYATFFGGGEVRGCTDILAGLLFQERSIQRMVQTTSAQLLAFTPIQSDQGTDAPHSIAALGVDTYFYGTRGFAVVRGGVLPIGNEFVDEWFLENCNTGRIAEIIGVVDPTKTRVFWLFPSTANETDTFDRIICYDPALNEWTHAEEAAQFIFQGIAPGLNLSEIAALYPTLEEVPYPFGSSAWKSGAAGLAAFDDNSQLAFYSGSKKEATVQTALFQPVPGRRGYVNGWRPLTDAANVTSRMAAQERPMDSPSWTSSGTVNVAGRVTRSTSGRYLRGEVMIPAGQEWEHLKGIEFMGDDLTEDGED